MKGAWFIHEGSFLFFITNMILEFNRVGVKLSGFEVRGSLAGSDA